MIRRAINSLKGYRTIEDANRDATKILENMHNEDMAKYSFWDRQLSGYRWYRKYRGGFWQLWIIDIIHCNVWFKVDEKEINNFRPGCGHGTPYCEYYPYNFFGYRNKLNLRTQKVKHIISK